ncbi:2109_t:CDS:2 [Cetraspora pellucida]|uniref:2109_t:CDS:1 n=1 Tax=Cetraspora pellucida TaxID=1433469 RepID=A0A9N9NUT9_9GLOM|nr:2109_t:CDS:2 [Cetraspora pellucida]
MKCLNAKQFASAFTSYSVIISQDNKAKVPFGISAVGRTFKTVQSSHKLVVMPGSKQKLIPSVYLMIDSEDSNDSLFDIMVIIENPVLNNMLKLENEFKPILVLLVDGGPNENSRHFKNIKEYCKLFIELNLDYLTIRTHASRQFVYNLVEHSMFTLLGKLADIVLPIDHFGSHLDSNSIIKNIDLAKQNFHYVAEEAATLLAEYNEFLPPSIKGQDVLHFSHITSEPELHLIFWSTHPPTQKSADF